MFRGMNLATIAQKGKRSGCCRGIREQFHSLRLQHKERLSLIPDARAAELYACGAAACLYFLI
jgi:hypothetical protein